MVYIIHILKSKKFMIKIKGFIILDKFGSETRQIKGKILEAKLLRIWYGHDRERCV